MSKYGKLLLSLILCLCLVLGAAIPGTASSIPLSLSGDGYTLDCSGKIITVTASDDYKSGYLLLRLRDSFGQIAAQKSASAKNGVSLSAAGLKDGSYYAELFTGEQANGHYVAFASGSNALQIQIISGSASMVISDTWLYNLGVYAKNRTDTLALSYYKTPSDSKILSQLAEQITSKSTTDMQKIRAVHDWVTQNICYDYDTKPDRIKSDPVSVYKLGYTNSVGYANLTAELLRQAGIPAKVVSGYAQVQDKPLTPDHKNAEKHTWNEAYDAKSGRFVIIDACWDSFNTFQNGKKQFSAGWHRYFDPSLELFSTDHLLDANEDADGLKQAFVQTAKNIRVSFARTTLYTGEKNHTANITITLPEDWKDADVSYASSKSSVVSVSKTGKLTGKKAGTATITVKLSDGVNTHSIKQSVKVSDPYLKFDKSVSTLKTGKSSSFTIKQYGVSGTVKWSVSDKTKAAITQKGKLTAKKAGTITVTANVNGVKKSIKVKITK